ncbi:Oxidoreductase [Gracilaria domingensis]|nr:Oxidoreductase [Gracilaria domingensis]
MAPDATGKVGPIRLALLGAGIFASSAHKSCLQVLQENLAVRVNLVWSRSLLSAEKLAKQYGSHVVIAHASSSDDAESVLRSALETLRQNRSVIDAVILAVPVQQLAPFSQMILTEGIPLLAEKPLAADLGTARRLLQESEKSKAIHAVAENFRFEPVFRKAHDMLNDVCGNIVCVQLKVQTPMPLGSRYGRGWRLDLMGTGILLDGMVHHIAGMRVVLGADIARVSGFCWKQNQAFSGPDSVNGVVIFSNNVPGTILVTYAGNTFSWGFQVIGTAGDLVIERTFPQPGYKLSTIRKTEGKQEALEESFSFSGIDSEFEAFIESCRNGVVHPDLDSRVAFNDLATVSALVSSSELKQWVNVEQWRRS